MRRKKGSKPKAAILTWCDNNGPTNYGQIFQCYAMQHLVKKAGFEPLVVQYRRKDSGDICKYHFSNRTVWGRFINEKYEQYFNWKVVEGEKTLRVIRFKQFIKKYIPLSPPCYTKSMVEEMTKDCRVLICGSDQIWNPIHFDPIWFLDFGMPAQKRIAYAPSGIFYEKPEFEMYYRKMALLIEKLDKVSVREQVGADILRKYVDKEIAVKEDPTLRLNSMEWDRVADKKLVEEPYIFCYLLGRLSPYQVILRELKVQYRAEKVVYIPTNVFADGEYRGCWKYEDAGPAQFLSLIKYAKAVCTDSFHGTLIAMQYGIPFYNVSRIHEGSENVGGRERIDNLLEKRGMAKRWVKNVKEVRKLYTDERKDISCGRDELRV